MSTGAPAAYITSKKLLGTTDFSTRFLEYLRESMRENLERVYREDGVYDTALGLAADGANKFQVSGTSVATDGEGNLLDITAIAESSGLQFENTNAIPYHVGLQHTRRPRGFQVNPRTGYPEFQYEEEYIGVKGNPNSVTDNGSNLTLRVDSITEAGVSNAGRKVLAYKKEPGLNATTEAEILEELTVVWVGGQNRVTTTGLFGQDNPSTDPNDYEVILLGPTVKRNTDLSLEPDVAYLGTVTGGGAGSPPSGTDVSAQTPLIGSLSNLAEITRIEPSNSRMKIEVKAGVGEAGIDQIRVKNPAGVTRYRVDEQGNVWISGNLTVQGTTTQNNIVVVNSSETITDNLTAGDDQFTDSHLIKGTWKHTNNAGTANYFYIDGASGRIGIGGLNDGSHALKVTGAFQVTGQSDLYDLNVSNRVVSNLLPSGVRDLGSSSVYWDDVFATDGNFNTLRDRGGGGLSINLDADIIPTGFDDTYDLGSVANKFQTVYTHDLVLDITAGRGVGSDIVPQADITYDLGTASRRWANVYTDNLSFSGNFLPTIDDSQNLGSDVGPKRWKELHVSDTVHIGDASAYVDGTFLRIDGTSSTVTGGLSGVYIRPIYTGNALIARYGLSLEPRINTPGSYSSLYGAYIRPNHYSTTSATNQYGAAIGTHQDAAAGNINSVTNLWLNGSWNKAGGINLFHALDIDMPAAGRVTGSAHAINVDAVSAAGNAYGIQLSTVNSTATNAYGLTMGNVTAAGVAYAIYTSAGTVRFGDRLDMLVSNTADNISGYFIETNHNVPGGGNVYGIRAQTDANHTSGTLADMRGAQFEAQGVGNGGTTTNLTGLYLFNEIFVGHTVTHDRRLWIGNGTQTGTATNRYGLYIDAISGATNNYAIYQLGTSTPSQFEGPMYFNGGFGQVLRPVNNDEGYLGANAIRWHQLYVVNTTTNLLSVSTTAGEGTGTLNPIQDGVYNLGSSSYRWNNFYIDRIHPSSVAGEGVENHLNPVSDDTYDLGSSSYQWRNCYIDGTLTVDLISLSTTAGEGFSTNLVPSANGRDLGSSSYRWDMYSGFIDSGNNYHNSVSWLGFTPGAGSSSDGRMHFSSDTTGPHGTLRVYNDLNGTTAQMREVGQVQLAITTWTQAQWNGTTSLELVPGQGTNTLIVPIQVMVHRNWGTTHPSGLNVRYLLLGGFTWSDLSTTSTGWYTGNYDRWFTWMPNHQGSLAASGSSASYNGGLYAAMGTANSGGDSTYTAYVWYSAIETPG